MPVITPMTASNTTGMYANSVIWNSSENFENISQIITTSPNKWKEIGRILEIIVRPIVIVFGTIFNMLSFYIMRKGSLKKVSTCFYMSILALADTGKMNRDNFWTTSLKIQRYVLIRVLVSLKF